MHNYSFAREFEMRRRNRLNAITKIISENTVSSQEDLSERLKKMGHDTSQSSLSRDLRKLGVLKMRTPGGVFAYVLPPEKPAASSDEMYRKKFISSVTGIRRSG